MSTGTASSGTRSAWTIKTPGALRGTRRMRILVHPHELAMGGSQINALELAGAVRDLGHDVTIFATPGVLEDKVNELRLPYIEAPAARYAADPGTISKLNGIVRSLDVDIVHAYEWTAVLNTAFGPCLGFRTRSIMTVLSMEVPGFLPRHLPLIVGTPGLAAREMQRRCNVHVIEPPIDTDYNRSRGTAASRRELGINEKDLVIAIVGRLTTDLGKVNGVLAAIRVVDHLAVRWHGLTLLVAGDGEGATKVHELAAGVNRRHQRPVVQVLGNIPDPRPVYDAADIVLGMGSSALRGMAYAKPLIVQGQSGFWVTASPETAGQFLTDGWFGTTGKGDAELEQALRNLLDDPDRRAELGAYGRSLVEERFSLNRAAERLLSLYRGELSKPHRPVATAVSLARTAAATAKFRAVVNWQGRLPATRTAGNGS
ncbi:glycosyltransferase family 4 protein [Arthrobacter sp. ISL-85]|uniref:glycosyltransferase family 4 protein n=1 Tax=Arthrobacter sp. ISL-85 TaxID=2819115 RepID=UPI001BEBE13E|nr:glycosyltransferase family 4 protein [Arthrobacter sp. ISL-85]MBT2567567.1 glycosyltransferase family 4 protein [Arthrobacter sp. ISL-85]